MNMLAALKGSHAVTAACAVPFGGPKIYPWSGIGTVDNFVPSGGWSILCQLLAHSLLKRSLVSILQVLFWGHCLRRSHLNHSCGRIYIAKTNKKVFNKGNDHMTHWAGLDWAPVASHHTKTEMAGSHICIFITIWGPCLNNNISQIRCCPCGTYEFVLTT